MIIEMAGPDRARLAAVELRACSELREISLESNRLAMPVMACVPCPT